MSQASLFAGGRVGSALFVREGVGWNFGRGAEAEVDTRAHILIRLFKKQRVDAPLALQDRLLEIADVHAPVPV